MPDNALAALKAAAAVSKPSSANKKKRNSGGRAAGVGPAAQRQTTIAGREVSVSVGGVFDAEVARARDYTQERMRDQREWRRETSQPSLHTLS